MTTLSPIVPERVRELTNRLRMVRYTPGLGRPLLELRTIYYAGWTIIDGLPPPDGAGGWRGLRSRYLLFESNFQGGEGEYLDAFSDVIPSRIVKLWGACVGFETSVERVPGARGRMMSSSAFREFVKRNELESLDFFAAYPGETVSSVVQAIRLQAELDRGEVEDDREQAMTSDEDPVLARMPAAAAMALGPVGPLPGVRERARAVYEPWAAAIRARYGVNQLTVAAPLKPGSCADEVRAAIAGRLGGLEGTDMHFARLVLIRPEMMDLGQRDGDRLPTSYLLYTGNFMGGGFDHVETLRQDLDPDAIWGACAGYPGQAGRLAFHAWFNNHTLPARYYVAGYPPRRVAQIEGALRHREDVFGAFRRSPHPTPSEILDSVEHDEA